MTIELGSHTLRGNCANSSSLPSKSLLCFFLLVLLSLYHQDLHGMPLVSIDEFYAMLELAVNWQGS